MQTHHIDKRATDIVANSVNTENPEDLLNTYQLANWLGVSRQWLEIGRCKGYGPNFKKMAPKMVRYRRQDVWKWLQERTHASTASYKGGSNG